MCSLVVKMWMKNSGKVTSPALPDHCKDPSASQDSSFVSIPRQTHPSHRRSNAVLRLSFFPP